MEAQKKAHSSSSFTLQGPGKIADYTASFPWKQTDLNEPNSWPAALKTSVSLMLDIPAPAFIIWGNDAICFYNQSFQDTVVGDDRIFVGSSAASILPEVSELTDTALGQRLSSLNNGHFIHPDIVLSDSLRLFFKTAKITRIPGEPGSATGFFLSAAHPPQQADTGEQTNNEKEIRESAQRVRSLVDSAPFPIGLYTGRELRIELANQSMLDVWGKGNDVIGKLYTEVLPELENSGIFQQLDLVYTTGKPFHARNQRVDLVVDGKLQMFYFNYSFTPVFDSDGKIYGVMNTAAEITDLVRAKEKLAQSERNLRNMVLQAPVAMCILLGPDHVVEVANDLMIQLWGKPREAVMNRPIFEGLPDARKQGLEALLAGVYSTGEPFRARDMPVHLLRNGKEETVYQDFVYEPYRDYSGEILGVLAITVDVTDQVTARRKIEEVVARRTRELATTNAKLQRSNADLAQFAYIASHDLQEPVRKVSSFVDMLEMSIDNLDDRSANYIEKIRNSATRMRLLIKDVLAYSELDKPHEGYVKVDLHQLFTEIVEDFELLIQQKGATVTAEDLPEIEAIPTHMMQLLGNLISNALKFTKPGVPPQIRVIASAPTDDELKQLPQFDPHAGYSRIEVRDNGIGFAQEYADNIFNIFQRLHNRKDYEGTGIGLAMCLKIVQNHHGTIYAHSKQGEGASFVIILPKSQVNFT